MPPLSHQYTSTWLAMVMVVIKAGPRMKEPWDGLGGKGPYSSSSPKPCHGQGHLPPEQVAWSRIRSDFEHFREGPPQLSGHPVLVSKHSHSKEFIPYISSKYTSFSFKPFSLILSLHPLQ